MDVNRPARIRCLAAAVAVIGPLAIAATGATATVVRTSGDASAISFYKGSRAAMAAYQGIAFKGGGTSYRVIRQAGGDVFKFYFGAVPKGYSAAVAHVRIVQRKGVITEEVDTLVAPGKPALRLWQSSGPEIGELLTAQPCPELVPANPASFLTIGRRFVGVRGRFAKLKGVGSAPRIVSLSYPLAGGTAHERDTIDSTTDLWLLSHLVVAGGPYNGNFLTESNFSYKRLQRFLAPPKLHSCS